LKIDSVIMKIYITDKKRGDYSLIFFIYYVYYHSYSKSYNELIEAKHKMNHQSDNLMIVHFIKAWWFKNHKVVNQLKLCNYSSYQINWKSNHILQKTLLFTRFDSQLFIIQKYLLLKLFYDSRIWWAFLTLLLFDYFCK